MAKKLLITVIVLEAFQDKIDHKTQYPVGTELQVEEERAEDLVSRGLAKIKEVPKEPKQPKNTKPADKPKSEKTEPAENAGKKEATGNEAPPAGDNPEKKAEDEQQGTEE